MPESDLQRVAKDMCLIVYILNSFEMKSTRAVGWADAANQDSS